MYGGGGGDSQESYGTGWGRAMNERKSETQQGPAYIYYSRAFVAGSDCITAGGLFVFVWCVCCHNM